MKISLRPASGLLALGLGLGLAVAWGNEARATAYCTQDTQNFVSDCDFAPGSSLSNWTFSPTAGEENGSLAADPDPNDPNYATDTFDAYLGTGSISESIDLPTAGEYSISFDLAADQTTLNNYYNYEAGCEISAYSPGCSDASVTIYLGVTPVYTVTADEFSTADQYLSFTVDPFAGPGPVTLDFSGLQDSQLPGDWYLENVRVDPAPVPEPGALPIFLTALAGWYSIRRWRRAA